MSHHTFTLAVADYFRARPGQWVSYRELMQVGGSMAWRSRVSDCRRQLDMTITNKVRRDEQGVATSWYRYEPKPEQRPLLQAALFQQGAA